MTDTRAGFTLIITVVLVATILLLLSATVAQGLLGQQQGLTSLDASTDAKGAAEGCAEYALLQLKLDPAYAGNETRAIGSVSCTIRPIISGPPTVIETEAEASGRPYRLRVELSSMDPLTVQSWGRVSAF
jgi:type II secretory pathway pseudopilin PulG